MTFSQLIVFLLNFYIPGAWSIVYRAAAYGYTVMVKHFCNTTV